jgi:hypothetical protein
LQKSAFWTVTGALTTLKNYYYLFSRSICFDQLVGDEYEGVALSLIAFTVLECTAAGDFDAVFSHLPTLAKVMIKYLDDENVPEISVIGPALNIISPVVWDLHHSKVRIL